MKPTEFRAALRKVLVAYPAIVQPTTEPESLGNAGGLSGALLWRFQSGRGLLVARAWPPEGPPLHALEAIHRWIAEAGKVGFLSVPIADRNGRTIQQLDGRLWEVAPWLPGRPPSPGVADPREVQPAFQALGALHQALHAEGVMRPSTGLRDRVHTLDWWRSQGFAWLDSVLLSSSPAPAAVLARQWLADARRAAPLWEPEIRDAAAVSVWCQPCLRDVRPAHFLFTDRRVTGLVDYGAMGIDSVAGDLARLLSEWVGRDWMRRAEALAAYESVRPLSTSETTLIEVFERSAALLGGGRWASWYFLESRVFRDPAAVVQGLRKGVDRLGQHLAAEAL